MVRKWLLDAVDKATLGFLYEIVHEPMKGISNAIKQEGSHSDPDGHLSVKTGQFLFQFVRRFAVIYEKICVQVVKASRG